MNRIVVIGTSGSGKTTLAKQIAARLQLPHQELDDLHWNADWQETPLSEFRERVSEAIRSDQWVIDGNYSKVRDLIWTRADTIVWLDYARWVVMWRVITRTLRRVITRESLWRSGNVETLEKMFGRDSVIVWAWTTYERRKGETPRLLAQYPQVRVIRLTHPDETKRWIEELGKV
ncbi:MAG: AAA family ATPase [Anaerolineae bacterium]|jgi:adenylate kinase family enzyme|nr:AAA family ATPase [Anaerolineae bacterium]